MKFKLNGKPYDIPIGIGETAIEVIRDRLRIKGSKLVCGQGVCGACTIMVEGKPVLSCLYPADRLENKKIETVENYSRQNLHPVQKAFMAHDALQCGFCTPGFVVEAIGFYDNWRSKNGVARPTREIIADAFSGHICRCGAYPGIYEAIAEACAGTYDGEAPYAIQRVDALEKVTGEAQFTADVHFEQQLYGVFVRSPYPHARIKSIDVATALDFPGVISVINLLEPGDKVRYVGQEIIAVAVTDKFTAEQALKFIGVAFDVMPFVTTIEAAENKNASLVYTNRKTRKNAYNSGESRVPPGKWRGNLRLPRFDLISFRRGKARRTIKSALKRRPSHVTEDVWTTQFQNHTPLEPHCCVAKWDSESSLTVFISTQACDPMAREIAKYLNLKPAQVKVICKHVGGAFGSKTGLTPEIIAACRLSRASGSPVKVELTRAEELEVGGTRPETVIELAMTADKKGRLQSLKALAKTNSGIGINSFSAALLRLLYPGAAKWLNDTDVVTHLPPSKPFRGPAAPQTYWASEQAIDTLAYQMEKDPINLRLEWDKHQLRQQLYRKAKDTELWQRRQPNGSETGRFRTGIGVAAGNWFNFYHPKTKVRVTISAKGISALCATQDIGTGTSTVIAKTIAEVYGLKPEDIIVYIGNSKAVQGPMSAGSRSVNSLYWPTLEAAQKVKTAFLLELEKHFQITNPKMVPSGVEHNGKILDWRAIFRVITPIFATETRGTNKSFDWLAKIPIGADDVAVGKGSSGSVFLTEVEVDTWLGKVKVKRVWGGIAVGKIIAPALALSQCHGGIVQGIGYALHEEQLIDHATGRILTIGLEDYRLPVIGDTPEIDIFFLEEGFEQNKGGAAGLGEIATIPVAASIGNAVFNATGWQPRNLPIRPDRLIEGLV